MPNNRNSSRIKYNSSRCHIAYLNGGEARVEPALDELLFYEPIQLALRQHGVDEIHLSVRVDLDPAQAKRLLQPVVLLVAIVVLGGAQGVRHTFHAVYDRTGEIVRGIRLVLGT